jgi:hypothetical protein
MTSFVAKIRRTYADMDGLMLDCRQDGLATDGSLWTNVAPTRTPLLGTHTGANNQPILTDANACFETDVLVGRNIYNLTDGSQGVITANTATTVTATLAGGADNNWDTNDSYRVSTPRFGNPYQDVAAQRPTVTKPGSYYQALFSRASSDNFKIPLVDSVAATWWTVAYEYLTVAVSAANNHPIVVFPNLSVWRQNAAGNYKYKHGAVDVAGAGDMAAGTWLLHSPDVVGGSLLRNGVAALAGTFSTQAIAAADPAGYIGTDGAGNYCDIILRSMQIWNRAASPLEVDFAYQSLSCEFDYNTHVRTTQAIGTWTDETGATPQEASRINYSVYAPQQFHLGNFPSGGMARVQIAAAVDGLVLPDTMLGGLLFDMHCEEYPSAGHPAVYQNAGWSGVWDVLINTIGHYTFIVHRAGSGSQVLHLDMEEV